MVRKRDCDKSISHRQGEKLLREKVKKNFKSISGEVSYLLHKAYGSEK